jgi:hypothetical protein
MKVHELMEILKWCNQDAEVLMSVDAVGNDFSAVSELNETHYLDGEMFDDDGNEIPDSAVPAVCLWPTY